MVNRGIGYGCGFGHLTGSLREVGLSAVGLDIYAEAIRKVGVLNSSLIFLILSFEDPDVLHELDPDIELMVEVNS